MMASSPAGDVWHQTMAAASEAGCIGANFMAMQLLPGRSQPKLPGHICTHCTLHESTARIVLMLLHGHSQWPWSCDEDERCGVHCIPVRLVRSAHPPLIESWVRGGLGKPLNVKVILFNS